MARAPLTFRERDLKAAIRAVRKAGETGPFRVEIENDGRLVVIIGVPEEDGGGVDDLRKEIAEWQP